jgi:hypothetical protein
MIATDGGPITAGSIPPASYRVHFWVLVDGWAPQLESWTLTGASGIEEVQTWIEQRRLSRPVELFAAVDVPTGDGFGREPLWIRLSGESPLEAGGSSEGLGFAVDEGT